MKNNLVSIIIVNLNGLRWLPVCFESLYKQDYHNFEIVFVDNASKDDSVYWVRNHYPKTKILVNKSNLGFAEANNVGYRQTNGTYVLFLNNDTRVTKTFLSELVKVLESDSKVGGAQSKILLMDRPDTLDSVGAFLTPTGFLYHYGFGQKDSPKYNKQIDLYTVKGACMIFKKEVLKMIEVDGWIFDPDYFAYFEETDMCHRVWLAGYRIVYAYKSVIYHKMGATSSGMNNALVQYHSFKNRINSYMKNLGIRELWKILPIHLFLCLGFVFYSFLRGKYKLGWAVLRAMGWNTQNIRTMKKDRHYIQKYIRIKSDEFLNPMIMKKPNIKYYFNSISNI